jgi:MOSC domain-containing protein YiiM
MAKTQPAEQEPDGVSSRHRSLAELEQRFRELPPLPADFGRVTLIVCRHAPDVHVALDRVRLTPEEGVPGDEWNRRMPRHSDAQLTAIRRDVAELVAAGQPLFTSGDNLIVDLDLSAKNLPLGTRLRVGAAVVEVTPKPHNGCHKFARRFGRDALRFVNAPATRHLNLRGIYWRVIESGDAYAGAAIEVLWRPPQVTDSERPKG